MTKLSDAERIDLCRETFDAAVALLDDIAHVREVAFKDEPTSGEIRRLTAQLRRMLVDRVIQTVASPRIGHIEFETLDVKPFVASNRADPIPFFQLGGGQIGGTKYVGFHINKSERPRKLAGFNPDKRESFPLDTFLKQPCICFEGTWIHRSEILKYIANVAHGVHSGRDVNDREKLIRRIRHVAYMVMKDGKMPGMYVDLAAFSSVELPAALRDHTIDCVLMEVLSTAQFLVDSPNVLELERHIWTELQNSPSKNIFNG